MYPLIEKYIFEEQNKLKFLVIYREIFLFLVIPFGQMFPHVMTTEESNKIRPDMLWHLTPQTSPTNPSGPYFAVHCPKWVFLTHKYAVIIISSWSPRYREMFIILSSEKFWNNSERGGAVEADFLKTLFWPFFRENIITSPFTCKWSLYCTGWLLTGTS